MTNTSATRTLVLSGCLMVGTLCLRNATEFERIPIRTPLAAFPMQVAGWQGSHAGDYDPRIVAVLGVTEYLNRVYVADYGARIGLYVGYYQSQRQGEAIHSPMNCLPGAGWVPVKSGRAIIPMHAPGAAGADRSPAASIEVNRYVIQKGLDKRLVLYWYQGHGRVVASEYWGKFYLVADAIRMNRTDSALVRVIVPIVGGDAPEDAAERTGIAFVRAMFPLLDHHLPA